MVDPVKILTAEEINETKSTWFGVSDSAPIFVGREEQMKLIAEELNDGIVVLTGKGGIGKSELASRYVRSHFNTRDSVIWINANTKSIITESFRKLAYEVLDMTENDWNKFKNIKNFVRYVYKFFRKHESIFIFDAVANFESIREFLLLGENVIGKPHFLITSSNDIGWNYEKYVFKTINIDSFTDQEAIFYVRGLLLSNDIKPESLDALCLAKMFQNFPLSLTLITTFIANNKNKLNFEKPESVLQNFSEQIFKEKKEDNKDANFNSVYFGVTLALEDIKKNADIGKSALKVLNILAYLAPVRIPADLFLEELINNDVHKLLSITGYLEHFSIVRFVEGFLFTHELIQKSLRIYNEKFQLTKTIIEENLYLLHKNLLDRKSLNGYVSHIKSIWNHCNEYKYTENVIVDENVDLIDLTEYMQLVNEGKDYEIVGQLLLKLNKSHGKQMHKMMVSITKRKVKRKPLDRAQNKKTSGCKVRGETPLHSAAKKGNYDYVKKLLENDFDVHAKTEFDYTPLHLSVQNGHGEIVKLLLEHGSCVNVRTNHKYTPLHLAIKEKHIDIVKILLSQNNIELDLETESKLTPLHFAARDGFTDIVKLLLEKGAKVDVYDSGKCSPLHLATKNNHYAIVQCLTMREQLVML